MQQRPQWAKDSPPLNPREMDQWLANPVTELVLTFFRDYAEQCRADWTACLHHEGLNLDHIQQDLSIRRDLAFQMAELKYDDFLKFYLSPEDWEAWVEEKQKAEDANRKDDDDEDSDD